MSEIGHNGGPELHGEWTQPGFEHHIENELYEPVPKIGAMLRFFVTCKKKNVLGKICFENIFKKERKKEKNSPKQGYER